MEQEAIILEFKPSGRGKARCPTDPDWPNGKDLDISNSEISCKVDLPYPAEECGTWIIRCSACGMSLGVTAAGRPDDPKSIKVPCKERGAKQ